ncbi:MAG TPA: acyl-CoA dehydrogenase family protein [Nocardia sp.]|uniref:acyl-CoA dehydrogenase family protein n=1 Tax=Nocardia sp. TaxID=1821 RepID=UPI002B4ABFB2|nr:acyl-CoA dehydrogenase family protein [Nocardia sp.]HLS75904.1 acyl-CoA dehydrogenase family protein [Nocardia sp.]
MTVDLSPEQRLFRDTTREFLAGTVPVEKVRALADSAAGFERAWWRRAARLGWTAPMADERSGGGSIPGNPTTDLTLVAEQLGAACAPGPFVTVSAALSGLTCFPDHCGDVIGAVVAGEALISWALYEPGRGLDVLARGGSAADVPLTGTIAAPHAGGYRLTGVKDRVEAADQADLFLVTALGPAGTVQLLVPADTPGVTVSPGWTLDLVRRTGRVSFDEVLLPESAVVHSGAAAVAAVRRQLHTAAVLTAAESVGATGRAMEATVGWLRDRYTFGRPLASYQALKHRMADNKTWLEAARATTYAAAKLVDAGDPGADEAVSVAKSYVGAKTPVIVQDCVQLHGGIGVTWEHDLHLYLRRVTYGRALYGTPEEHRRHITDLIDRAA